MKCLYETDHAPLVGSNQRVGTRLRGGILAQRIPTARSMGKDLTMQITGWSQEVIEIY